MNGLLLVLNLFNRFFTKPVHFAFTKAYSKSVAIPELITELSLFDYERK